MNKLSLLKEMLVNSSIGSSAIRNQGNGIAEPIREKLIMDFSFTDFFDVLNTNNTKAFQNYLNTLTDKITGLSGKSKNKKEPGIVKWGTARKCINLLLRSTVYNGLIWHEYQLSISDFKFEGKINNLEIPLDSYVTKGIKKDCRKYKLGFEKKYSSFTILGLNSRDASESSYYQAKALEIAEKREICRVDLDLCYWRKQNECID